MAEARMTDVSGHAGTPRVASRAIVPESQTRGPWRTAWHELTRSRLTVFGLVLLALLLATALFADVLAPYPYTLQEVTNARKGPSPAHWLGTDELGRDMLSRVMYGARVSLSVAIVAQAIILFVGVPIGAAAGYYGGWIDTLLSRAIDVLYSFPDLLLIIIVVTSLRAALKADAPGIIGALAGFDAAIGGLLGVFISLALVSWLTVARLVRGQVLSLREREFVEAARALGASGGRIVRRHLLPNA